MSVEQVPGVTTRVLPLLNQEKFYYRRSTILVTM
jgi:hypothetical protein